jgi:hypothetical protein
MTESNKPITKFAGTYFERDSILRLARLADIFAWITLIYYIVQASLSVVVFVLQIMRGLIVLPGFTDVAQQIIWFLQPLVPGLFYFIGIEAIGKLLLIFMDIEDNSRRAIHK